MANSSKQKLPPKGKKPRPDFPLFVHQSGGGRWAKKVRGKFVYFGKVADDPKGERAIELWTEQKDDLLAGRKPRGDRDGLTVHQLCNLFCAAKESQRDLGDITPRTYDDYHATCKRVLAEFGKDRLVDDLRPDDFEALRLKLGKGKSPNTLANEVQRVRVLCKYAYDSGLIDKPIRFGPTFKRPAKRILRAERQSKGPRLFEARQIRRLLKAADPQLRAMILLGVNCGFGNNDCGRLPTTAIDLRGGWIDFPRPKTAVPRRCKLWPETVEALKAAIEVRPQPKEPEHGELLFVTRYGQPWAKDAADSPVAKEFRKLTDSLGIYRPGLTFYALRHTFETIAGGSRDQVATSAVMGHVDSSMSAHYRERIEDSRLEAVAAHVRLWLFRRDSAEPWGSRRVKSAARG